jgi:hypothetical protein
MSVERVRLELNHDRALSFCFDPFSSNALARSHDAQDQMTPKTKRLVANKRLIETKSPAHAPGFL